jgi:hypothetical protein
VQRAACPTKADVVRIEEQPFDPGVRISQEADRSAVRGFQHPPVDRVVRQLLRDEWSQHRDVALLEEVVRGAHGAFPQHQQLLVIVGSRATDVHVVTFTGEDSLRSSS